MSLGRRLKRVLSELQARTLSWVRPQIVRSFAHDPEAYTQGLAFHRGMLYESTGLTDASSLRIVDISTGRVCEKLDAPGDFAEGIGILGERLYQLTWLSGRVLIYSLHPLRQVDEARIGHEGWGLASDGRQLLASDGSQVVRRYDSTMSLVGEIRVRAWGSPFLLMNDIEVANGRLYANVWRSGRLAEIDPSSGRVMRMINCSELVRQAGPRNPDEMMNGIAFNPEAGTFFVTGKRWRKCFEIRLPD